MNMADLEAKVKELIIDQLGVEVDQVTLEANFEKDLGADSLDGVELVMAFEQEFDIEIPDEDAEGIRTMQNAVDYLKSKLKVEV